MTTIDKTFAGMRKFSVRRFANMFFQWVLLLTEGLQAYKVTSTVKLNTFYMVCYKLASLKTVKIYFYTLYIMI